MSRISPSSLATLAAVLVLTAVTNSPAVAQEPAPPGFEPVPPDACRAEGEDRIPLMVIGSYHMANPGRDAFNLQADDITTDRRQAEIRAVVSALADFRPTRVAVEARRSDREEWQRRYESYVSGDRELAPNEREQIGFRLAARMGHDSIHSVDVSGDFPLGAVRRAAEGVPRYEELMEGLDRAGRQAMETLGRWLEEGTVGQMLWRMNTPAAVQANHRIYFEYFLPVLAADSFPGADLVRDWYGRNLRIFALLQNLADADDRIVVIYGQGHAATLRQFTVDDPRFCRADPLSYLEAALTVEGG